MKDIKNVITYKVAQKSITKLNSSVSFHLKKKSSKLIQYIKKELLTIWTGVGVQTNKEKFLYRYFIIYKHFCLFLFLHLLFFVQKKKKSFYWTFSCIYVCMFVLDVLMKILKQTTPRSEKFRTIWWSFFRDCLIHIQ